MNLEKPYCDLRDCKRKKGRGCGERENTHRVWKQILRANASLENIPNCLGFYRYRKLKKSLISSHLIHFHSLDPRGDGGEVIGKRRACNSMLRNETGDLLKGGRFDAMWESIRYPKGVCMIPQRVYRVADTYRTSTLRKCAVCMGSEGMARITNKINICQPKSEAHRVKTSF